MRTSDEIRAEAAEQAARLALAELRRLFMDRNAYEALYRDDVVELLGKATDLTSYLEGVADELKPRPSTEDRAEPDATTAPPTPLPLDLQTRGAS